MLNLSKGKIVTEPNLKIGNPLKQRNAASSTWEKEASNSKEVICLQRKKEKPLILKCSKISSDWGVFDNQVLQMIGVKVINPHPETVKRVLAKGLYF